MIKFFAKFSILFFIMITSINAQYTDVINSNRPGGSYSAFSVGKDVIQGESGLFYETRKHKLLNTKQNQFGIDFAVRYGLLFEQLEIIWDGTFANEKLINNAVIPASKENYANFIKHTIGAKYLVYDPFKKRMEKDINIRSWNANHHFQWTDLIPAVSLYAGANINFGNNPFNPNDPTISPKFVLATQSHLTPRWVFVTNFILDKIVAGGYNPEFTYILTLTHTLYNPKYSIFFEHQGIKSDDYGDGVFRAGAARLINKNFQVDASLGTNIKNTPTRIFGSIGISYRLDYHSDEIDSLKGRRPNLGGVNPFDEDFEKLDTLSKSERRKIRKLEKLENKRISDSLLLNGGEAELTKAQKKRKLKQQVKERKKVLDSLNKEFEDRRSIQTKEILEKEDESGGFIDVDESKLSKQQLKDLKKARKDRAKKSKQLLKEEAKSIKEEERKIQEEEKRLMQEQEVEDEFFEDEAPPEEKSKKKKKRKKKKKDQEEIFDDF